MAAVNIAGLAKRCGDTMALTPSGRSVADGDGNSAAGERASTPVVVLSATFGLYDMVGKVWEWVDGDGAVGLVKGGSFLCATNYCANFRPAAFQAQEQDFPTSHIGFRVAYRPE